MTALSLAMITVTWQVCQLERLCSQLPVACGHVGKRWCVTAVQSFSLAA